MIQEVEGKGCSHGFVGFCDSCHELKQITQMNRALDGQHLLLVELNQDVRKSAENLCWMAQTVHQGHHETESGTWKECSKGVCGSMEHMLAQIGYGKDLNVIVKVP